MRIQFVAVLITALLSACSQAEEPADAPAAPAAPAAASAPGRPAIYAAATESPEAFVRAIYAVYVAGGQQGEPPPPGRDPIYGRMLNAMIGADFAKAAGEAPHLNYDPLCACQDSEGFTLNALAVAQSAPAEAEASVAFTNAGQSRRQTLKLVKEGRSWKVADVLVPGEPPLTEQLLKVIG
jgi:hypothetical protein